MLRRLLLVLCTAALFIETAVFADETHTLPKELQDKYPYRVSQNEIMYAPWLKLVGRASDAALQNGTYAGENAQVTGTISFSDANPDHVIAGFDTNCVAVSTDGGANWYYSCTDVGTHACMNSIWHPTDENTVYRVSNAYNGSRYRGGLLGMANNKGLLRSRDCGKTWEKILDISMHSEYACSNLTFDRMGRLYALTNGGLYRSSDDGDTWEQLNDMISWTTYDIVVSDDCMTILTATVNGINVSFDGGSTWQLRNGKQYYGTVTSVDIDPLDQNHWAATFSYPYTSFAHSYDKGKTWSGIEQANLSRPFKLKFGGIRDDGTRYMYAIGVDGSDAYRYSKDNGATWQNAMVDTKNEKANRGTMIEGLALSRKYPDIVWYAFGDGINCSHDGGVRFNNRGYGHGGQKLFKKIVTDSRGRIHFPGTDSGYFHTTTAYTSSSFPTCSEPYRLWGSSIAISPYNKDLMMLGGGEQGTKVMWRSLDCGETWRQLPETLSDKAYTLIEFHKKKPNIIYTNQSTSFDGGNTWLKNKQTIKAVSPVDNDIVFAADPSTETGNTDLFISHDCGETFEKILSLTGSGWTFKADVFDAEKLWMYSAAEEKLFYLDGLVMNTLVDFRTHFENPATIEEFARDPEDEQHMLVALTKINMDIGYGAVETFDGGKTWHVIRGVPGNGRISMICFEERTNDIFLNGYCGIMIYDSNIYKEYLRRHENEY